MLGLDPSIHSRTEQADYREKILKRWLRNWNIGFIGREDPNWMTCTNNREAAPWMLGSSPRMTRVVRTVGCVLGEMGELDSL